MPGESFPLVSITIPTYNRADGYLRQAIECALRQTYQDIEIIVSDNCSTDTTERVVKGFNDPRIRYFRHKENIGANNNFNFCLKEARGNYFLLLHDDDLIDADFIETCLRSVDYRTDVGVVLTGNRVIDAEGKARHETPNTLGGCSTENFFRGWFASKTALYLCSTLFNTAGLREIGGFRSRHNLFQDVVAEVRLAAKFGRADVREVKASYRKHPFEMTFAVKVRDWCEDSLLLLNLMCELAAENPELIRTEGMRFFATLNYNRARAVRSPLRRFLAYLTVFGMFRFRHLPPRAHIISPLYNLLEGTPVHHAVRSLKRRFGER